MCSYCLCRKVLHNTKHFTNLPLSLSLSLSLSQSSSFILSPDVPRMQQLFSAGWQQNAAIEGISEGETVKMSCPTHTQTHTLAFFCTCVPLVMSSAMLAFGRVTPIGRWVWGRGFLCVYVWDISVCLWVEQGCWFQRYVLVRDWEVYIYLCVFVCVW